MTDAPSFQPPLQPQLNPMTPGELRGVLSDLGLSNEDAARLIGVAKSTLAPHWLVGPKPVPIGPAVLLLRLLRADPALVDSVRAAAVEAGSPAPPRPRGRPARPMSNE